MMFSQFTTTALLLSMGSISASSVTNDVTNSMENNMAMNGGRQLQENTMRVFATSEVLKATDIGGISGADDFCQSLANNAGLGGIYKAWLSDSTASPSTQFAQSPVPYVLVDGTQIATDWDDLIDGTLDNAIKLDENGDKTEDYYVWTGTETSGESSGNNCDDWTSDDISVFGTVGAASKADWTEFEDWTEFGQLACNGYAQLYCFEQYTTCTVSPAGGNCAVDADNDATCDGIDTNYYSLDSCSAITCNDRYSCYGNTITSSESLECNGKEACERVTISSVMDVSCFGDDSACQYATISDVPDGGSVDCGKPEEAYRDTCREASFTSEKAFTLTCAGAPGTSVLACGEGHVTNPGGSVFCYGGASGNGICHDLTISDSVGCVLCASDDACENVKLVDGNGNEVHSMKNHQVAVYSGCEASDIVVFLNKVHPAGGSVDCQDNDGDGYCDVVEKYCDRKSRDTYCVDEFKVVDGSWTKEKITSGNDDEFTSMNDIDPDSLLSSDKVNRESWIVGSIVILMFLVLTITVVYYIGQKHSGRVPHQEEDKDAHETEEEEHVEHV